MVKNVHRAFGVYGIIQEQDQLVVIKKNGGPYINRYDLPGGSLEEGEELGIAVEREIREETGLIVSQKHQLGITSFIYPWRYQQFDVNQHIAVFYAIQASTGKVQAKVEQFPGQDALGAEKMAIQDLNQHNASPLVMKAKNYILTGHFDVDDQVLASWEILDNQAAAFKR